MNREQYLLLKLGEEASEITQIVSKTSQFGMEEKHPDLLWNNKERVHQELNDLLGIVEMLNEECDLDYTPDEVAIQYKKKKVNKYYEYSKKLGKVK